MFDSFCVVKLSFRKYDKDFIAELEFILAYDSFFNLIPSKEDKARAVANLIYSMAIHFDTLRIKYSNGVLLQFRSADTLVNIDSFADVFSQRLKAIPTSYFLDRLDIQRALERFFAEYTFGHVGRYNKEYRHIKNVFYGKIIQALPNIVLEQSLNYLYRSQQDTGATITIIRANRVQSRFDPYMVFLTETSEYQTQAINNILSLSSFVSELLRDMGDRPSHLVVRVLLSNLTSITKMIIENTKENMGDDNLRIIAEQFLMVYFYAITSSSIANNIEIMNIFKTMVSYIESAKINISEDNQNKIALQRLHQAIINKSDLNEIIDMILNLRTRNQTGELKQSGEATRLDDSYSGKVLYNYIITLNVNSPDDVEKITALANNSNCKDLVMGYLTTQHSTNSGFIQQSNASQSFHRFIDTHRDRIGSFMFKLTEHSDLKKETDARRKFNQLVNSLSPSSQAPVVAVLMPSAPSLPVDENGLKLSASDNNSGFVLVAQPLSASNSQEAIQPRQSFFSGNSTGEKPSGNDNNNQCTIS